MADSDGDEEETLRIDADSVTIRRYYFPWGGSKTIARSDIVAVTVRPASWSTRWRLWGSSNFRNWLPLEMGRPGKEQLVEIDVGKRIRPSVTPDDASSVVELLRR